MYEIFEALLKERGITAYKVAKETGISTATLTDWKKGRSTPKTDKMQKIADYLGVPLSRLLGQEEPAREDRAPLSDEDVKVALFGGAGEVTDAMWEEVKGFIDFVKEREKKKRG